MFLEQLSAAVDTDAPGASASRLDVAREWLTARPEALFDELRAHAPTLSLGALVFVTRFDDVLDVLTRDDVFSVAPYGAAMTRINRGTPFLLGLDDGPVYREQLAWLHAAFPRDDAARVRDVAAAWSDEIVVRASAAGRLDLADGFGRLVASRLVGEYVGVPGPDPATLMDWARAIFLDAFANVLGLSLLSRRAMRASAEFQGYLDTLLAERTAAGAAGAAGTDVVGRLVALHRSGETGPSVVQMRDLLLWTTAGTIDNVNTAVCYAIDQLLERPDALEGAKAAGLAGDTDLVWRHAAEALRFRPATPVVTRRCLAPHVFARGTPHETAVAAGALVCAGTGAAMMDEAAFPSPREFRLDRPVTHDLHFGAGLHQCLGRHLAQGLVTTMVGRVLALPGLRRARGRAGRLPRLGLYPRRLLVEFERHAS